MNVSSLIFFRKAKCCTSCVQCIWIVHVKLYLKLKTHTHTHTRTHTHAHIHRVYITMTFYCFFFFHWQSKCHNKRHTKCMRLQELGISGRQTCMYILLGASSMIINIFMRIELAVSGIVRLCTHVCKPWSLYRHVCRHKIKHTCPNGKAWLY